MACVADCSKRQHKAEFSALSRLTVNTDRAAHQLYQLLGNCSAKAGTTKAPRHRCIRLSKRIEHSLALFLSHTDASI